MYMRRILVSTQKKLKSGLSLLVDLISIEPPRPLRLPEIETPVPMPPVKEPRTYSRQFKHYDVVCEINEMSAMHGIVQASCAGKAAELFVEDNQSHFEIGRTYKLSVIISESPMLQLNFEIMRVG